MTSEHIPTNMERIVESAILAPSSHNTQPWKFTIEDNEIHIFPDFERSLPVADPEYRELIISLGCALENLIVAARHEGFAVEAEIFPQGTDGIVAKLRPMLFPPDEEKEAQFEAIPKRQTTRSAYDGQLLPPEVIESIRDIPLEEGVHLRILTDRRDIDKAATLVRKADEYWMDKPSYRKELADWVRFSKSSARRRRDGLTSPSTGRGWAPEWLGRFFLRFWIRPEEQASEDVKLIRSASAMLLFFTVNNDPAAWVRLGQSFERVALTLTDLGLKHAHHNQPCEIPAMRTKFRSAFGPEIAFPQLLVRIGYAEELPRSPRRELEEVVA